MPIKRKTELEQLTRIELIDLAKAYGLKGFSKLTKAEIVELVFTEEKKTKAKERKIAAAGPDSKTLTIKAERKQSLSNTETETTDLSAGKTAKKGETPTRLKHIAQKKQANGIAIQHPSASPSALKYGRIQAGVEDRDDSPYKPVIWPDRERIPDRYGKDRLTTLIRDPFHIVCFWEISHTRLETLSQHVDPDLWRGRRMVLRVFRDTGGLPKLVKTIDVFGETGRYHVAVSEAGTSYYTELGFFFSNGRYETLLTDKPLRTPQVRPPRVGPVKWLMVKPYRLRKVITLETATVIHPSPKYVQIQDILAGAVAQRRKELDISDAPSSSGSVSWPESDDKWITGSKSGRN